MKILLTGAAGFIGAHCTVRLLRDGHRVVGVDNFNDYYDPALKEARVEWVREQAGDYPLLRFDLANAGALAEAFSDVQPDAVIHLAAQAGVRYSLQHPHAYTRSNIEAFLNILEGCRAHPVRHLLYASSSSVYGANQRIPYSVHDNVDHPLSLYAATKKANELMAHAYSHLFRIPCTGLRFFTVYGPWGRPDMSPIQFARAISAGQPLELFNHGLHQRDFTYIDDIVEGVVRLLDQPPPPDLAWDGNRPDPASSTAPWRVLNIGGQSPVELLEYVATLEKHLGRQALVQLKPLQPGDVLSTCADASDLQRLTGFTPRIGLDEGIARFVEWFSTYYPADLSARPDAVAPEQIA